MTLGTLGVAPMPELSQNETPEAGGSSEAHRHRHKRKRRSRKKLYRKLIIVFVSLAVGAGALTAWHFLVQNPPPRTAVRATAWNA